MKLIINFLEKFSFWGVMFICFLLFGIKVPFVEIINECFGSNQEIRYFSIYVLISIPLLIIFVIKAIIVARKSRKNSKLNYEEPISCFFWLYLFFENKLWIPYKPLDLKFFSNLKFYEGDKKLILEDLGIYLIRVIDAVIWWAIVAITVIACLKTPDNAYLTAFQNLSQQQQINVAISAVIFFVIAKIFVRACIIIDRKITHKYEEIEREKRWKRINSYGKSKYMPAGCRACGGPYPNCKSSCKLFDD